MTVGTYGVSDELIVEDIVINYDGGGVPLSAGVQPSYYTIPYRARIVGWYIVGNPQGSIIVDILKLPNGQIPSISDSICGSEKPTLNSEFTNNDLQLTSWNKQVYPGDTFGTVIESAVFVTNCTLTLKLQKL
jgi:hypothetical protein